MKAWCSEPYKTEQPVDNITPEEFKMGLLEAYNLKEKYQKIQNEKDEL